MNSQRKIVDLLQLFAKCCLLRPVKQLRISVVGENELVLAVAGDLPFVRNCCCMAA